MRDRVPTKVLPNGAIRFGEYDESGNLLGYKYIRREDEPTEAGTPNNKANLMPDALATKLGLNPLTATVAEGIGSAYSKAVVDAKNRTIIYDQKPTTTSFVVDLSSIDFTKVRRLAVEGYMLTAATTSNLMVVGLRNGTTVIIQPTVDIRKDSTGSRGIIIFDFCKTMVYTEAYGYTTGAMTSTIMDNPSVITNVQITANSLDTSIATRRLVIWYD